MSSMDQVLAVILGGGRGNRLLPLTAVRSKPAVPIAGKYRLIDIPISNCINSGIYKIAVLTQLTPFHCTATSPAPTSLTLSIPAGCRSGQPSRLPTPPTGTRARLMRSGNSSLKSALHGRSMS